MPCTLTPLSNPNTISVFETTLNTPHEIVSVFHLVIEYANATVSLVRYPFDFVEFHHKIRHHYPKSKIPFPVLNHPTGAHRLTKRRSLRNLFTRKSNADKIEKYLWRCFDQAVISISTILRDFLSVQRNEDSLVASTMPTDMIQDVPSTHEPMSLKEYELLKVLGKGCMGKVLLVRSKRDRRLYALKVIKKDRVTQQKEVMHTRAERDILARLRDYPFLIKLYHAFQTPTQLYFVLDYYGGGDIATQMSHFSTFSKERTQFYAAEILHGLSILHQHGIIYRDLKPENILIGRDGHIVLTDFGLSKVFTSESSPMTHTFCGTAEYLAPEVLLGEPYTYTVDYWSLGTLLYEMLAGVTPFWAETHMEMYRRVLEDPLQFPSHFDAVTCDFLFGLLQRDPTERLGWWGPNDIKNHRFFESLDWEAVAEKRMTPPYIPQLASETDLVNFDDTFVNMTPRISQTSTSDPLDTTLEDPFENFSFDPDRASTVPFWEPPPMPRPKLERQKKKWGKERFSSSSSLLSVGEIIRHSDTLFSNQSLFRPTQMRQRQSVVLCQSQVQDKMTCMEEASIYSKSSINLSSIQAADSTTGAGSDFSEDILVFQRPSTTSPSSAPKADHSPYQRPHCPVPGQIRPMPSSITQASMASTTLSVA